MRRVARAADGTALLGDEVGFVPLATADPALAGDALHAATADLPDPADAPSARIPDEQISFATPVERPGKLLGIGLNYVEHADDLAADAPAEPASFLQPATSLAEPGSGIRLPPADLSERVTAEAELAVVIGRECREIQPDRVDEVIAGYVPVVDVTAEDVLQRNPRFLTRAKSFDTFFVMGRAIRADDVDLADRTVRTVLNDEVVAHNSVSNMEFSPSELVAYHSRIMTLERGDVIATGTPGAAEISPGDRVRAEVEGVGSVEADVSGPA